MESGRVMNYDLLFSFLTFLKYIYWSLDSNKITTNTQLKTYREMNRQADTDITHAL